LASVYSNMMPYSCLSYWTFRWSIEKKLLRRKVLAKLGYCINTTEFQDHVVLVNSNEYKLLLNLKKKAKSLR